METKVETTCSVQIVLNADVRCAGSRFGRSVGIVMDPETCQLTHLLVRDKGMLGIERMAPIYLVEEIAPKCIDLLCTGADLTQLEANGEQHEDLDEFPDPLHTYGDNMVWPYRMSTWPPLGMPNYASALPRAVVLRQDARVMATNGLVGRVNGLLVNAGDWQITHMTLRQHHLWGDKVFAISVSDIARIEEDSVYLQLAKADVKGLRTATSG